MKALQAKIRYLEQENQQLRATNSGNIFIENNKSTIWNQEPDENITLRIT
jgi:hypothetical protein